MFVESLVHLLGLVLQVLLLHEIDWQIRCDTLLMHTSLEMAPCVQCREPRFQQCPEVAVELPACRRGQLAERCANDGVLQYSNVFGHLR
jgi:hypothetical protein